MTEVKLLPSMSTVFPLCMGPINKPLSLQVWPFFVPQRNLCIKWEALSILRLTRQDLLVFLSLPRSPDGTSVRMTIVPPGSLTDR